eukprot:16288706-Heterocapsa_arctica.AAC.1
MLERAAFVPEVPPLFTDSAASSERKDMVDLQARRAKNTRKRSATPPPPKATGGGNISGAGSSGAA